MDTPHLGLLALVLDLLGRGVRLLLTLLRTTSKTKDKMKRTLFLNIVVAKSSAILKLFSGKNQSLLVRGNAMV